MNPPDLHPVPYRRMSTDAQDASPARQAEVIRDYCRNNALALIPTDRPFLDEAITGTTNDRPQLRRLIAEGRQFGANAVIIDQMSRISRTDALEAAAEVYLPLRRAGIRYIIDASKGAVHDLHDTNCILFVTIEQGHGSHAEAKSIAHRVASGVKALKEQGYVFGRKPPRGYRIVNRRRNKFGSHGCGKLEIVPEEAAVIRRVFQLYQQLRSSHRVAQAIGWIVYQVEQTLNQAIYCGRMATKPRKSVAKFESVTGVCEAGSPGRIYRNKEEVEYQDGIYPPIISPEEWDRCQAIMKGNRDGGLKRQFRGGKYKGKIFCLDCSRPMQSQFDRYKKEENRKMVYLCATFNRQIAAGEQRCKKGKRVMESLIDAALGECLDQVLGETGGIQLWEQQAEEGWQTFKAQADAERKRIEADKAALDVDKARAIRNILQLEDAPEILADAKAAYTKLLDKEKDLAARLARNTDEQAEKKAYLERCRDLWDALLKGEILELVSRVTVRFQEQTRVSRPWKNKRGETRGGHERTWQVPVDCLIEFKSMGEEPGPIVPLRFEQIGSTAEKGQHGIAHTH